jgi:phage terminase large subunit-like protein
MRRLLAESLPDWALPQALADFDVLAHDEQRPPPGAWTTWLLLGGRGAGKTRAGAEWVRALAAEPIRIALVGETFADVRETMVEGLSGLRAVFPAGERPRWEASRRRLLFSSGAVAQAFSSEDPDSLRGPQFHAAWADELGKWRHAEATFDMLQLGLRLGPRPRQAVTTTPRPIPLVKRLIAAPDTALTRAPSALNASHLAPGFLDRMAALYGATRLGRQELLGELVEAREGALFTREDVERARIAAAPPLSRVVVAVDPAVSGRRGSDACGMIAAGVEAGVAYVLEDATLAEARPEAWAAKAVAAFHRHAADALVVEVNQGGDLVAAVLKQIDPNLPVRPVRATRGKWLRAEPVAALLAAGRVRLVGAFPALEDEMSDFGPEGLSSGKSPDRLDALVWAVTALLLEPAGEPRVRRV